MKALCQTLGDLATFALCSGPDAGRHEKRLILEPKNGLPTHFWARKGCHIGLDLCGWPAATSRFSDDNLTLEEVEFLEEHPPSPWVVGQSCTTFSGSGQEEEEGKLDFYLRSVAVVLLDVRGAKND